jgi:hypothetical protein
MQRTRGLSAIYQRIKNEVARKAARNGVLGEQDPDVDQGPDVNAPGNDRGNA